ncbi:MAG: hypothetical protein JXD23_15445 [Spirochaetales bacterium]|nr:hypothetical protein [Spirochaetales bacterium]
MLKDGPPFKKKDFFFGDRDRRLFRIAVLVTGGAAVLCFAALITAAITAANPRIPAAKAPPAAEAPGAKSEPTPAGPSLTEGGELSVTMSISSFVMPDDFETSLEPEYVMFRPRTGKWDRKEIERYWVPPARIGLEKLEEVNDKNIKRMFDEVQ